jgi:hypothetical protein
MRAIYVAGTRRQIEDSWRFRYRKGKLATRKPSNGTRSYRKNSLMESRETRILP